MAVYVDPIFEWPIEHLEGQARRVAQRNGGRWAHMIADTPEELHALAKRIGLKLEWAQEWRSGGLHYDLTPSRRAAAVRAGAIEIASADLVPIVNVLQVFRKAKAEGLHPRVVFKAWAEWKAKRAAGHGA